MSLKILWHNFIVNKVKAKNLYCDNNSIENATLRKKRKYKLALKKIMDLQLYPFFILNSKLTFSPYFSFKIEQGDWCYLKNCGLSGSCSYVDLRNPEIIEQSELYNKIQDSNNFYKIADLSEEKFIELSVASKKIMNTSSVADDTKGLILKELTGDTQGINADEFFEKYKI